jgi:hypothetical protein
VAPPGPVRAAGLVPGAGAVLEARAIRRSRSRPAEQAPVAVVLPHRRSLLRSVVRHALDEVPTAGAGGPGRPATRRRPVSGAPPSVGGAGGRAAAGARDPFPSRSGHIRTRPASGGGRPRSPRSGASWEEPGDPVVCGLDPRRGRSGPRGRRVPRPAARASVAPCAVPSGLRPGSVAAPPSRTRAPSGSVVVAAVPAARSVPGSVPRRRRRPRHRRRSRRLRLRRRPGLHRHHRGRRRGSCRRRRPPR